jgi:hypothetical protein
MNTETRLDHLERIAIRNGECLDCRRWDVVYVHPGEPEPPRRRCATCGRAVGRVIVQYRDWTAKENR